IFPGGSLTASPVIDEGQTEAHSGSLSPAGVVKIQATVGTTPIATFNQPVRVAMQLDAEFDNANTSSVLEAGDQLGVYRFDASTGIWHFERNCTIENEGGKLVANFEADHSSWYMVGDFVSSCVNPVTLNFNADWMQAGITYSLKVEALFGGKVINAVQVSASTANTTVKMANLPLSASGVTIRVSTLDGQVLTSENGVSLPQNGCNATHNVLLNPPTINYP